MHFDNLLFLLLVLVAVLLRVLASAANKASKRANKTQRRSTSTPPPVPREPVESDADRIRKFLEALGQPPDTPPLRPVAPRPTYQKPITIPHVPPPIGSPLPPLTTRPPDLPETMERPVQTAPQPRARTFAPPPVAETTPYQITTEAPPEMPPVVKARIERAPSPPRRDQTEAKIDIITMLASPSGLRDLIVLREILGPPRSFQPLDLVGT
jgi:hypothetical protein